MNLGLDHVEAAASTRIAALESTVSAFESWRPYVESSIADVKSFVCAIQSSVEQARAEISQMHAFLEHEAKDSNFAKPCILGDPLSAFARPPAGFKADGPNGHRVERTTREHGFGRVYVQTQLSANGTIEPPPSKFDRMFGSPGDTVGGVGSSFAFRGSMGHLPKMHFPKFDGDNPKLWIHRSEDYFDVYSVDHSLWVRVASTHFVDAAACWLQSVEGRIRTLTWPEFCKLLLEHFGRDQHELLIRQILAIKRTSTVRDYIDCFTALVDQLHAYERQADPLYYTMRFIDGLRTDIKSAITIQHPVDLDTACVLV